MSRELLRGLDGGIGVQAYIDSCMESARTETGTIIGDFFRFPDIYFVSEKSLSQYLGENEYVRNRGGQWTKGNQILTEQEQKNILKVWIKSQMKKDQPIDEAMLSAFIDG